jgi:ribosome-associated heat shock protein Hsp15
MTQPCAAACERLDKWLWQARFFKSRTLAARAVTARRVRVNQEVITKAHYKVRPGDVLTFVQGSWVRVVRVRDFTTSRGPASLAQTLYEDLKALEPAQA